MSDEEMEEERYALFKTQNFLLIVTKQQVLLPPLGLTIKPRI